MSLARVFSGKWPYQKKKIKAKKCPPADYFRPAGNLRNEKNSEKVGFGRPPLEFFREKNVFQEMQKIFLLNLLWSYKWPNHVKTRLVGQIWMASTKKPCKISMFWPTVTRRS